MSSLENKVPPLLLVILFTVAMWLVSQVTRDHWAGKTVLHISAIAALSTGVFFCVAGVVSFRRAKTAVDPLKPNAASSLVTSGIYRVSRNPMYVGFAFMLGAWAAFLGSIWSLLGVLGFMLYLNRFQIVPEERALSAIFPAEFEKYKLEVRRWL